MAVALTIAVVAASCSGSDNASDQLQPEPEVPAQNAAESTTPTTAAGSLNTQDDGSNPSVSSAQDIESDPPSPVETEPPPTTEPPPPIPGVLFVSGSGSDEPGAGRFSDAPLRTPAFAVREAVPGDVIEIGAGTYAPFEIVGRTGIEIRTAPEGGVVFTSDSYTSDAGVRIADSQDIVITGLTFERLLWGIQVVASQEVTLRNNVIRDIGQEAISVREQSTNVDILENFISLTGQRPGSDDRFEFRTFGEGIYLGTGSTSADGSVDVVSDILIDGNVIQQTTAEAIDVKASVESVVITNNLIHDIDVASGGAITIGRGTRDFNADVVVEGNAIYNVTTWGPYSDGIGIRVSSTAQIRNNAIWGTQHRGILVDEEFRSIDGGGVEISDNLIFDSGNATIETRPQGSVEICGTIEDVSAIEAFDGSDTSDEAVRNLLRTVTSRASC